MTIKLNIPTKGNKKLEKIIKFVENDTHLNTLWNCSNTMAINRQSLNDHGPIHIKIVANRAIKLLRMLVENDIEPSIVKDYGFTVEDAEVVVLLGSVLHDLGLAVVRNQHELFSVPLSQSVLARCLPKLYDEEGTTIVMSEVLHAVLTHHEPSFPLTIEAGIVKVADALDMEKGRARIPLEGSMNIHSVSAHAIEKVDIENGDEKPIVVRIKMKNPAGVFQVDNLLGAKVIGSGVEEYMRVEVYIGENETPILLNLE
jgi:metal-dependent HD superfamily phosphatase/phosphodiesterase